MTLFSLNILCSVTWFVSNYRGKSIRPSSARPAPPKPKKNEISNEEPVVMCVLLSWLKSINSCIVWTALMFDKYSVLLWIELCLIPLYIGFISVPLLSCIISSYIGYCMPLSQPHTDQWQATGARDGSQHTIGTPGSQVNLQPSHLQTARTFSP